MKQEIKELMQGKSLNFIAKIQDKLSEKFETAKDEMRIEVGNSMLKEDTLDEKLHGKQHKLDHDEDGDIDAKDMKDVRKKGPNDDHPMAEENLDEVSKGLMGRYIKGATAKVIDKTDDTARHKDNTHEYRKDLKSIFKTKAGINKATDKLTGQAKVPAK